MIPIFPKLSVIITIFNSEKFINDCVRSLFGQTLDSIEYIFVNDATPDKSILILESILIDHPTRRPYVKILNLEENGGVSNARRIGIQHATGEYLIHCDSDDWIDKDMYERLYQKAKETDADIVGCNFRHEYADVQYDFHQQYADTIDENISRLINGRIFPSLCTSLTRQSLIVENGITFPSGLNMGEDLFFNLQLYLHAKKIVSMDWAPYHYRHTEDSSCVQKTRKSVDSDIAIAGLIEKVMKEKSLYEQYAKDIEYRKFFSKLPLIKDLNNKEVCQEWLSIYPETHKHIWQYDQISFKQKIELWFAANNMFPIAKAYKRLLNWQHSLRYP
ncbi:MAG: glycosyltransferase [Prevotella sp.]|nr:glycosyltransferase [Prevotella sp.]